MSFFGNRGQSQVDINIKLESTNRLTAVYDRLTKNESKRRRTVPIFQKEDGITGEVTIRPKATKPIQHFGISVVLSGHIESSKVKGCTHEFLNVSRELEPAGFLTQAKPYKFDFSDVAREEDSYYGPSVKLYYQVSVVIRKKSEIKKSIEFVSVKLNEEPTTEPVVTSVGSGDIARIEFTYDHDSLPIDGVLTGSIKFKQLRLRARRVMIQLSRIETAGTSDGKDFSTETEDLGSLEVLDGSPAVGGTSIPVRIPLAAFVGLSPTYLDIRSRFSVKYFVNLIIVSEDNKRFYKQRQITLYRSHLRDICSEY